MNNDEAQYSSLDVERLIGVKTLTERMANLSVTNASLMTKLESHMSGEDKTLASINRSVERLHQRIEERDDSLMQCRIDLENKIKNDYVTKPELSIELERLGTRLIKHLDERIDPLDKRITANRDEYVKMRNILTGIVLTVTIAGGLLQYVLTTYKTATEISGASGQYDRNMNHIIELLQKQQERSAQ
jgi:hypothetical protein